MDTSRDDELDFVSVDMTLHSDEPLPAHVTRTCSHNAQGTPSFKWRRLENVPHKHSFSGNPGLKVTLGDGATPLEIFKVFVTDDISHIVEETNRYVELMLITLQSIAIIK